MDSSFVVPDIEEYLRDESYYLKLLENKECWRKIPYLNYTPLHELKDLSLVRFRGMIQDMLDPEIYLEKYKVVSSDGKQRLQNGKYRDCLVLQKNEKPDYDCFDNIQCERRAIFVVSVPGLNEWAYKIEQSNCSKGDSSFIISHNSRTSKRPIAEDDDEMSNLNENSSANNIYKRQFTDENLSSSYSNARSSALSSEYLLNSPLPNRPSKACLIKLYSDFDTHTLNSIIDVVGFLSVDPALDASSMLNNPNYDEFESFSEQQALNPPPSLIPRVHAVAVRKLEHNNPLLDTSVCELIFPSFNFESVFKDLRILLTQCLLGDELAADYLLTHLISTIYTRSELHNLGKFALNICNIPQQLLPNYTEDLYNIMELFLPSSHYFPMTLDAMNTLQFFPKKDYQTNKLTSGILQLAPHTHLVLDETRLQPGKLENNGVRGIQCLAHFIKTQQLKCDFQYYEISFNTDVPILVLSEGKSLLPNDFQVPLNVDKDSIALVTETLKAARHYAQSKLDAIRCYLTKAKLSTFNMNPTESEMIQNDFVEMRKMNAKVGAEELHKLLVLSRLLAIASGKSTFDRTCWEKAKQMENVRINRMEMISNVNRSRLNIQ